MKFLLVSKQGAALALAFRLKQEGHDVLTFISEKGSRRKFDGLLRKIKRLHDGLEKDRVILFDSPGAGGMADRLRSEGFIVFGSSKFADLLWEDREAGFDLMVSAGIKPAEANAQGMRVTIGGWFNGKAWVENAFALGLSDQRLMNDDLGPLLECASCVVSSLSSNSKLVQHALLPVGQHLSQAGFSGPIQLQVIASESGIVGVAWTPLFAYDSLWAWLSLFEGDIGKLLVECAMGRLETVRPSTQFSCAIRITVPLPLELGLLISGFGRADLPQLWFGDVFLQLDGEAQELRTGGADANVVVCTSLGSTVDLASHGALALADRLVVKDKQYRTDCGNRASILYTQLEHMGYLSSLSQSTSPDTVPAKDVLVSEGLAPLTEEEDSILAGSSKEAEFPSSNDGTEA